MSVAKSFDAPIKLLFPRALADTAAPFSMLGLGDIVVPGIFVAIVLRYDMKQATRSMYFYRFAMRMAACNHIGGPVITAPDADSF